MRKAIAISTPRVDKAKTNQNNTGSTPSNFSSIFRPSTGTFPPLRWKEKGIQFGIFQKCILYNVLMTMLTTQLVWLCLPAFFRESNIEKVLSSALLAKLITDVTLLIVTYETVDTVCSVRNGVEPTAAEIFKKTFDRMENPLPETQRFLTSNSNNLLKQNLLLHLKFFKFIKTMNLSFY